MFQVGTYIHVTHLVPVLRNQR